MVDGDGGSGTLLPPFHVALPCRLVNQSPEAGEHAPFILHCSLCVLTLDPGPAGVYTPPLVRTPNSIA